MTAHAEEAHESTHEARQELQQQKLQQQLLQEEMAQHTVLARKRLARGPELGGADRSRGRTRRCRAEDCKRKERPALRGERRPTRKTAWREAADVKRIREDTRGTSEYQRVCAA